MHIFLPVMLFALFGGVLADRLPKRAALVTTQTSLMIQAAIFGTLVATGLIQLWHVYVLAVIQGLIAALDNPLRQAFVFEMVGRDDAAFIGTFGFNFSVIVPLVADNVLKTDATGYGLLSAAMGVGALMAALGTAYAQRITMQRLLISGGLFSIVLGLLALSTSFWLSVLIIVMAGLTGITYGTAVNSLLQLNTPEQLRGRVMSINILLTQGSTPVGGFFLGSLGQLAGVETAMITCAMLCLFGVGAAVVYRWGWRVPRAI